METIAFKLIFVSLCAFTASAVNQVQDKDLMTILAKERQEMRQMFERETARLLEETALLHAEDKRQQKELKEQNEKLQLQDQKLKEQNDKIRQGQKKDKLKMAKLRRENQKLRRADAEIKQSIRQRDQKKSLEVSEMKNTTHEEKLKKMIRNEITDFLMEEKICVSGVSDYQDGGNDRYKTIEYGYTFPRKPTVSASLNFVYNKGGSGGVNVSVMSHSNSSAIIRFDTAFGSNKIANSRFSWIACL